ncbi:ABC transporter ATP-binding protein [Yinghuangia sp. YIM S09857]|uniref:ABC transporter ATP-binding protein n=1 Tax=Yinghuangia sp. YIM S09857 TaxID=3436929 RepID=UPI003F52EEE4
MTATLLSAAGLTKTYRGGVQAVREVSFSVARGETLGIVGESGCGKSTTAKMLLRLVDADSGTITFDGADITKARGRALRSLRARIQVVPQDPRTSLNPRLRIADSVEFNLRAQGVPRGERPARVRDLLGRVGINRGYDAAYPHELSGGQLQRVAIARALVSRPDLVVCDEPVSALDKSVQAQVLNLMADLQSELGVAYVFISHDLSVVEHVADRVAVMYSGRIVEEAPTEDLWRTPRHPYTRALLASGSPATSDSALLRGDPPSPTASPPGCSFHQRCPSADQGCTTRRPDLSPTEAGHLVACLKEVSS